MFQLQPSSIYLVKEFDNVAVFPHETSGRFNRTLIDPSAVYTVHGDEISGAHTTPSSNPAVISSYGAYTGPTAHLPPSRIHTTQHRKSNFRKTLPLVSLSAPNKPSTSRASFNLDYKVITQVVVSLEMGHCSAAMIAELVRQQVGFEVILLDSKCFPLLESDATKSHDFWKSNRKVLAASRSLYVKLTGSDSANPKHADTPSDDDVGESPQPKRCCSSADRKLDKILLCVEGLKKNADLTNTISSAFECVICIDIMQRPLFGPCCGRIVGCQQCISRWFEEHDSCPHCSTQCQETNYVSARGFEDALLAVRSVHSNMVSAANTERCSGDEGTVIVTSIFQRSPFGTATNDNKRQN